MMLQYLCCSSICQTCINLVTCSPMRGPIGMHNIVGINTLTHSGINTLTQGGINSVGMGARVLGTFLVLSFA